MSWLFVRNLWTLVTVIQRSFYNLPVLLFPLTSQARLCRKFTCKDI